MTTDHITTLKDLPSLPQLHSQLLSLLQLNSSRLVSTLSYNQSALVSTIASIA
jgi:ribosomal protein L10